MSWRTTPPLVAARAVGRKIGINRILARLILGKSYEQKYDTEFSKCIRKGDNIWDIGANIGHYTCLFADRVGNEGKVFAFEPSPTNFLRLQAHTADHTNVVLLPYGLSEAEGTLKFQQGEDELGATSRINEHATTGIDVQVYNGKSVLAREFAAFPNLIKIDVEGFELDVIRGMLPLLDDTRLRAIGIEIHFGLLEERGIRSAPSQIEKILSKAGFSIQWPDPSHILARR